MIRKHLIGIKIPAYAAIVLAFASLGDAFLYPFLPIHAETIGILMAWVGILLSINRLIRIVFNQVLVYAFSCLGFKKITMLAAMLAVLSTAGYGMGLGIAAWVMLRVLWGIAFSALRISTLSYALAHQRQCFSLGVSKGVYELWPMFALLAGPILLKQYHPSTTFLLLAMASLPAVYFAARLPELTYQPPEKKCLLLRMPSTFNLLTFVATFLVEGMLIVLLGVLLLQLDPDVTVASATALAAAYLAFRRISFLIFSPLGGHVADKWGFDSIFSWSIVRICFGFMLLLLKQVVAGLALIFIFNSINASIAPGGASKDEEDKVQAVAENATWRDAGAALGALIGGLVLASDHLLFILLMINIIMISVLYVHLKKSGNLIQHLYLWR